MPRPDWVNVRSDLTPQNAGYIMLDKTNLATAVSSGDSAWTLPTLAASWTNAPNNQVRYRKDANGFVHLAGGAVYTSGAVFTGALFSFPVGYRPGGSTSGGPYNVAHFPIFSYGNGYSADIRWCYIGSDGTVKFDHVSGSGSDNIEFGGLSFFAEN